MIILKSYTPTARKNHRCDFCFGTIAISEKYEYQFIVNGGDSYSWKSHFSCKKLAQELKMFDDCPPEGLTTDSFQEFIHDNYNKLIKTNEQTSFEHKLRFLKHKYHVNTQ